MFTCYCTYLKKLVSFLSIVLNYVTMLSKITPNILLDKSLNLIQRLNIQVQSFRFMIW